MYLGCYTHREVYPGVYLGWYIHTERYTQSGMGGIYTQGGIPGWYGRQGGTTVGIPEWCMCRVYHGGIPEWVCRVYHGGYTMVGIPKV